MSQGVQKCCVCEDGDAKYRCPRCDRRTCTLKCVEQHKERWQCSGKRSRTSFTATKDFTDKQLISDLRFLEEANRVKETNWRNLRRVALVFRPQEIPPHQRKLRYEARQRRIRLHYLPRGMSRSKCNSSWFDHRKEEICWDIDWVLPFIHGGHQVRKKRVPESETVQQAMTNALALLKVEGKEDGSLSVVMKKVGCPSNEVVYFAFDLEASLKSQLEETELVEYPVLTVLRDEDRSEYTIHSVPSSHQTM